MDIIGKRFGKLVVLSNDPNRKYYVICKCDCGNIKSIRSWSLTTQGKRPVRSCGCQKERACLENAESHNKVDKAFNTKFGIIESDKPYINNKSGYKGVCWDKCRNKWCADIRIQGKRFRLGRFDNIEDAVRARIEAEEKLHEPVIRLKEETFGEH